MNSETPSAFVSSKKALVRDLMEHSCLLNFCSSNKSFLLAIYTLTSNHRFQGAQFFIQNGLCLI